MGSYRNKNDVQNNKNKATHVVDTYLQDLIDSGNDADIKKADLISFWLKEYTDYIKNEKYFIPAKQTNYKRGNIVKVNLGFNIGNEEGGLHYAVVVSNPSQFSGLVTIVPITSKKGKSKLNPYEISLGMSLFFEIITKLNYLYGNIKNAIREIDLINDEIIRIKKHKNLLKMSIELKKYIDEVKKMKNDESIALVGNITTISKQRIYTPTVNNKFLKGISISKDQLNSLDKKIIELYTK